MAMKAGFLEKLIGRLGKIGPEEVQNYLLRLAQEKGFLETVFIAPLMIESRLDRNEHAAADDRGYSEQVGYAIIMRDITESRRTVEKTIASERLSALTLLAAGVAHELGNPLNSLNIHLQLMERQARKLKGKERDELQHSIDICRGEINRLDSIVTQFLRAIRPSRPQLQPENINAIVEEAVRFFSAEIEARDIVVETELRSDLPLLQLDRGQMKQAFYNVIKNSFEAMKRRGILRIRTDMDESHVRVSFIDTGGGMSAETLSHVFEPYYTTKERGTGLGLLIVRRTVREHGGE